jgi:hypothetical protein
MREAWRSIPNWPGYEVSDLGRVRSLDRYVECGAGERQHRRFYPGRLLKPLPYADGYLAVSLGAKSGKLYVHRLVLDAFDGPCPEGMESRHLDDVKTNNRLANLVWGTRVENVADAIRNGRRFKDGAYVNAKLSPEIVRQVKALAHLRPVEIAKITGVDQFNCAAIRSGRNWGWLA